MTAKKSPVRSGGGTGTSPKSGSPKKK